MPQHQPQSACPQAWTGKSSELHIVLPRTAHSGAHQLASPNRPTRQLPSPLGQPQAHRTFQQQVAQWSSEEVFAMSSRHAHAVVGCLPTCARTPPTLVPSTVLPVRRRTFWPSRALSCLSPVPAQEVSRVVIFFEFACPAPLVVLRRGCILVPGVHATVATSDRPRPLLEHFDPVLLALSGHRPHGTTLAIRHPHVRCPRDQGLQGSKPTGLQPLPPSSAPQGWTKPAYQSTLSHVVSCDRSTSSSVCHRCGFGGWGVQ